MTEENMDTLINEQFNADQEIQAMLLGCDGKSVKEKLEDLRSLSNISQALENLLMQCRAYDGFKEIEAFAELKLRSVKREMQMKIHG
jgi:hypothetical protein